ncbi:MAG TPA: hypothetical protein VNF73_12955, partial [Candidatus Saccharimonadales bacterium]|nr:hypothetical protein [Candidatus Saccharimonadales bacterium]
PFSQNVGAGADPNAGQLVFATNGESVNVTAAGQVQSGQQGLTVASTAFAHPAGEVVTQTVSNCSPVIGSPGVVVGPSPGTGQLCIVKFNDLNGNGRQDPGEPFLGGFLFSITDAHGNVVGTITSSLDAKNCTDLVKGTYLVTETPGGWTATTTGGLTQTAIVVSGQTTTLIFGNQQTRTGTLCIVKFNDLNGSGRQDPGEPLLGGWVFTVKDGNGNVVATLYSVKEPCIDLPPGTYTVTETPQSGWTPTTAGGAAQIVTVIAGQSLNVTFGNHRCCLTFVFLSGRADNFSLSGATEPVVPAPAPPTTTQFFFDGTVANRAFSDEIALPSGNVIQSAILQIRMKPLCDVPSNDTIKLKMGPAGATWSKYIDWLSYTAPQTGNAPSVRSHWACRTPAKTFTWDLFQMPGGANLVTVGTGLDATRLLDVYIQDDTSIDYIKLTIVFCERAAPAT